MHLLFIAAMLAGVYSTTFAMGGTQIFFIGLANLYIFVLIFLAWPVKVRLQKYRTDDQGVETAQVRRVPAVLRNGFDDVSIKVPESEQDRKDLELDSGRAVEYELQM